MDYTMISSIILDLLRDLLQDLSKIPGITNLPELVTQLPILWMAQNGVQ